MPRPKIFLTPDGKIRVEKPDTNLREQIAKNLMNAGYEEAANYVMEMELNQWQPLPKPPALKKDSDELL